MKTLILNALSLIFIVFSYHASAQTTLQIKRDSALVKGMPAFAKRLGLTPTQQSNFLARQRSLYKSIDSFTLLKRPPKEKTQWLTKTLKEFDKNIKQLFTAAQWKMYQDILAERKQVFAQEMNRKKIKYKEIKRD